jgi:hypothetical protein
MDKNEKSRLNSNHSHPSEQHRGIWIPTSIFSAIVSAILSVILSVILSGWMTTSCKSTGPDIADLEAKNKKPSKPQPPAPPADDTSQSLKNSLTNLTLEQATAAIKAIAKTPVEDPEKHSKSPIPWNFLEGNHCKDRAVIAAYGLANFDLKSNELKGRGYIPTYLTVAEAKQFVKTPSIVSAKITLEAPIEIQQKYAAPKKKPLENLIYWINHHATVIKVNQELHVVDLAFSNAPIKLKEWISKVVKEDNVVKCSELSALDLDALHLYLVSIDQGSLILPKKPKSYCGYRLLPIISHDVDESGNNDPAPDTTQFDFVSSSMALAGDAISVKAAFPGLKDRDIPNLISKAKPVSLEEKCADPTVFTVRCDAIIHNSMAK